MKKIIGIAGVARSGKDTITTILNREFFNLGFNSQRFALADELKNDLYDFILDNFNIDIWNCTDEEKLLVRPLMVAYGGAKRKQSKGKYWTSIVQNEHISVMDDNDVAIIPDIRYAEYDKDEVDWLKDQGGILIHVTRLVDGKVLEPPNEDEKRNDPELKRIADFKIAWSSFEETDAKTEEAKVVEVFEQIKKKWNL